MGERAARVLPLAAPEPAAENDDAPACRRACDRPAGRLRRAGRRARAVDGGSIAQQLAADHPSVVGRLVLVSTACRLGRTGRLAQRRVAARLRACAVRRAFAVMAAELVPPWRGRYVATALAWRVLFFLSPPPSRKPTLDAHAGREGPNDPNTSLNPHSPLRCRVRGYDPGGVRHAARSPRGWRSRMPSGPQVPSQRRQGRTNAAIVTSSTVRLDRGDDGARRGGRRPEPVPIDRRGVGEARLTARADSVPGFSTPPIWPTWRRRSTPRTGSTSPTARRCETRRCWSRAAGTASMRPTCSRRPRP